MKPWLQPQLAANARVMLSPLAASWALMGIELPLVAAVMARFPEPDINLAAYGGIVFPLALIIEAPIIMLLAASTALSWGLWDSVIARMTEARRAARGLPVRGDEIAFMQALFPELIAVGLVVVLGLLLACRSRPGGDADT